MKLLSTGHIRWFHNFPFFKYSPLTVNIPVVCSTLSTEQVYLPSSSTLVGRMVSLWTFPSTCPLNLLSGSCLASHVWLPGLYMYINVPLSVPLYQYTLKALLRSGCEQVIVAPSPSHAADGTSTLTLLTTSPALVYTKNKQVVYSVGDLFKIIILMKASLALVGWKYNSISSPLQHYATTYDLQYILVVSQHFLLYHSQNLEYRIWNAFIYSFWKQFLLI